MKAIVLARVSDKKQDSNEAQVMRIADFIKSKDLEVWKTYEIEESSSRGDRKKFHEVIKDIEKAKEPIALVVDTIDRLQRSFKESVLLDDLRKSGKLVIYFYRENLTIHKDSNSADILRWEMGVLLAHSYILQLSDNVKRTFEHKRRNGEWTGTPPIGYMNVTLENEKKDIMIDPERGHLIQALFEYYATGNYSITTLWQKMTKMGLRNRDGREVARSNIEYILKDPFYHGVARSLKYGLYPHRYPTLITRELFDTCQRILTGRKKQPAKMASAEYSIFKGLIRCGKPACGCSYSPELKKKKGIVTYACSNGKHVCRREYMSENKLLKPIYKVFDAFESIPQEVQDRLVEELRRSNESEVEFHSREITRVRAEYDRHQRRLEKATELCLDGSITPDERAKIVEKEKDAQYRLDLEMEEHTKADHEYHIHVNTVLNLTRRIRPIFAGSEVSEKRAIINFILSNLTVSDRKLTFSMRKPFDAILDLAHHPNGLRRQDSNLEPSPYT